MPRILICNVSWMKYYRGIQGEKPEGGGSWVKKKGYGHELYNFLPYKGRLYGYVQAVGDTIAIEKLGANPDDDYAVGVTVVWVATEPSTRGTYVVGWYRNATVYRHKQNPPADAHRQEPDTQQPIGFNIAASESDARCLPVEERVLSVPRRGKGNMGQSNVWYADSGSGKTRSFLSDLHRLLKDGPGAIKRKRTQETRSGRRWQQDVEKRARVEKMAEEAVARWYSERGYSISGVQHECFGWDLEASKPRERVLQLEVKGLSGSSVLIELTPNEYRQMKKRCQTFRLCIVTQADKLKDQKIHQLRFQRNSSQLEDDEGRVFRLAEVVGARVSE